MATNKMWGQWRRIPFLSCLLVAIAIVILQCSLSLVEARPVWEEAENWSDGKWKLDPDQVPDDGREVLPDRPRY